jgi:undecaprenyl diphosphate synthase
MDGNGRWAKKRFLPRLFGHRAGVETVRKIVRYASDMGVSFLTLYAFSTENWSRPVTEVDFLMDLFKTFIEKEKSYLHSHNVVVKFIGSREDLSDDLLKLMTHIEKFTENNTGLTLILAINYGGRKEIISAMKKLIDTEKTALMDYSVMDLEKKFSGALECSVFPPPDLLIRTAGEKRISNFLLWHIAYSEFYFSDKLWPEFDISDLALAFSNYATRERRFGAVPV